MTPEQLEAAKAKARRIDELERHIKTAKEMLAKKPLSGSVGLSGYLDGGYDRGVIRITSESDVQVLVSICKRHLAGMELELEMME